MFKWISFLIGSTLFLSQFSCVENERTYEEMQEYDGPLTTMNDVINLFSDSAKVKVRLAAPVQQDFKNGTQKFPKGLKVEFFEKDGEITSVLTANEGVFDKATNIFTATGNVVVKNLRENRSLNTEELHWKRTEKQVYTDKYVTIASEDQILEGTGLTAPEDFSTYTITNPTGVFYLEDDSVSQEEGE